MLHRVGWQQWSLAGELLLNPRNGRGYWGVFAAASIRKRGSEISVGISESKQPQAEASDPSGTSHDFNQSGEAAGAEYLLSWGMWMPKQDKTLVQPDTNASMEALEFLAALFIVITLPEETSDKQSRSV